MATCPQTALTASSFIAVYHCRWRHSKVRVPVRGAIAAFGKSFFACSHASPAKGLSVGSGRSACHRKGRTPASMWVSIPVPKR